jgi:hypothetical protein
MPNGIYPVPAFRHHSRTPHRDRPGRGLRLKTWWHRDRLDEQLARRVDPNASAELKLRAEQLVSLTERVELADSVERAVREARGRPSMWVPMRRAGVRECASDLLALAQRLRAERPVDVRGAAMTRQLLTDGATSPLYYGGARRC